MNLRRKKSKHFSDVAYQNCDTWTLNSTRERKIVQFCALSFSHPTS